MEETVPQLWRTSLLPKQLIEDFDLFGPFCGQKYPEAFGKMHKDSPAFEHAHGFWAGSVKQRWSFRIRVDHDKSRAELVATADFDEPSIVFRLG